MHPPLARTFFRLHEALLGRKTFRILAELTRSQYWPPEKLRALQLRRLRGLVAAAYEHTPYWREVMDSRGFGPDDIRSLDDVRRFPLLHRQTIRDRREEMVWRGEGPRVLLARTSGSTNAALEFYTSSRREAHITAARMRGHAWVGCPPGAKEVYFWAAPVELGAQDRIKALRDRLRNDLFTSALLITPEVVPRYVEQWRRWGVNCLFGYVSSFVMLARIARQTGVDLAVLRDAGLRCIVTTSELLGENRQVIAEAFGMPVYDSYGVREGGLIGHECEHQTLHTNDEMLLLEVLDRDTLEPTDGEGELAVTMLASHCMPVIRYRTGDVVTRVDRPCPCGRTLPALRVSGGRVLEFIVTRSGKWVSAIAFIYVCRKIRGVTQLQARQERRGQVRVLVAVDEQFPPDGLRQVEQATRQRLEDDDEIAVEIVDEIPPAPSGKQRIVISEVARQLLEEGRYVPAPAPGGR